MYLALALAVLALIWVICGAVLTVLVNFSFVPWLGLPTLSVGQGMFGSLALMFAGLLLRAVKR